MSQSIGVNMIAFQEELVEGNKKQWEFFNELRALEVPFVEVRREFFRNFDSELNMTREKAKLKNLKVYYSVPDTLFVAGKLNEQLEVYLQEAKDLHAKRLKLTLGEFESFSDSIVKKLNQYLERFPSVQLSIENDQSEKGGSAELLSLWILKAHQYKIPVSIIFDTGNFAFIGEVPEQSARILNDFVDYIHIKNVKIQKNREIVPTLFNEGDIDLSSVLDTFRSDKEAAIEYSCGNKEEAIDVLKKELQIIRSI
ncbi:sugar phosphate isomerase/epimerase [Jeotgalibaca sp. MA1X17-3]|uniref:sugar phosphate isomerase/epimerase family protein n=1 Tax=Jeotgalibaca sp. MA1X17-3 TaxID=2908211 RepID=UPI001F456FE1|nr:sugar phosphate isomerase/epimerase [Jeotgalibaca sp. MA1X17-3]UJF14912.1 sugar phosphate isomerase/epimerase [Jeotgalibaca sp. MA1X17-3]